MCVFCRAGKRNYRIWLSRIHKISFFSFSRLFGKQLCFYFSPPFYFVCNRHDMMKDKLINPVKIFTNFFSETWIWWFRQPISDLPPPRYFPSDILSVWSVISNKIIHFFNMQIASINILEWNAFMIWLFYDIHLTCMNRTNTWPSISLNNIAKQNNEDYYYHC